MKKCLKNLIAVATLSTLAMPAFAGVLELELADGGLGASRELVFVAKTEKQAILKIAQPGLVDALRDGTLDDDTDLRYGFAFGQLGAAQGGDTWEDYVIDTIAPDGGSVQDEICGGTALASQDHISAAVAADSYTNEVNTGVSYTLDGDCQVSGANNSVVADVRLAMEVVASGGATIDISIDNAAGVDETGALDSNFDFATFTMVEEEGHDAAGVAVVAPRDFSGGATVTLAHGESSMLHYQLGFDAIGPNAKEVQRASSLITAGVTP